MGLLRTFGYPPGFRWAYPNYRRVWPDGFGTRERTPPGLETDPRTFCFLSLWWGFFLTLFPAGRILLGVFFHGGHTRGSWPHLVTGGVTHWGKGFSLLLLGFPPFFLPPSLFCWGGICALQSGGRAFFGGYSPLLLPLNCFGVFPRGFPPSSGSCLRFTPWEGVH